MFDAPTQGMEAEVFMRFPGLPPMSADLAASHSKPHFVVPPGACDCHMHIFGPAERYPAAAARTYTPRPASLADYCKMAATIGLERVQLA